MKYRLLVYFLIVIFNPILCFSQQDQLLDIINSQDNNEVKQLKIDSSLLVNKKIMSQKALADYYHDLGSKWYFKNWRGREDKKDIEGAILHTSKASDLKIALDTIDEISLKKTLYNLGYFNSINDDFFEAINAYTKLIDVGTEDLKTLSAYRELGKAYKYIGDFYKSINSTQKIISFYNKKDSLNNADHKKLIDAYTQLSLTYYLMGAEEFSKEIQINIVKADSLLAISDFNKISYQNQINQIEGNRLLEIGQYKNAIAYHKKVLDNLSELDSINMAIVYNSLAFSQLKLLNFDEALTNIQKSITYDKYYTDPYNNLGDLHIENNEFEKGLLAYQNAITYSVNKNKTSKFDDISTIKELEFCADKIPLLNHIITKANGWVKYYHFDKNINHLDNALKTFILADQLVDLIRFESTEYKSKLFWRQQGASLYMKAVEVCYLLKKPNDAYYFMEKNKALLLLEDITNEQAKEITKLPSTIAKQEFELKRSIFLLENKLQNKVIEDEDETTVKNQIYSKKQDYDKFIDSLKIKFPEYARLKNKIELLDYKNFKNKYISDTEIVLQYILNDNQGYGLLTSQKGPVFFQLNDINELDQKIDALSTSLSKGIVFNESKDQYLKLSNSVFRKLIPENVYNELKGKKLTIVPDYTLQLIPFETLITNQDHLKYLIEDVEIRYVYSMSYLDLNNKIIRNPNKDFIGFAPINFDILKSNLSELIYSGDEITAVENIYSGDLFIGENATKSSFLEKMNDYKIIHLSTHADVGLNNYPWVAFSDKKISLNEIYATKNQSELVVLSACNSSLGEVKKGEGVMSLARGFFHSGTKSVISSLWSIDEKNSKKIITDFYKGLSNGLTKANALRKAKLNYIKTNNENAWSPNLWGAIILIGDNEAIQSTNNINCKWIFILVGLIIVISIVYIKRKK